MSRPSWDPFPYMNPASGHANAAGNTSTSPALISSPISISSEDARLLDPSYLSSLPLTTSGLHHGYFGLGSGLGGGGGGTGLHTHTHVMPYIDAQGTLHDPDYRPFPIIQHASSAPSPFAVRKQYWEIDEEWENEREYGDEKDDSGSTPNTPTSTPFICYFLETHPLKRGATSSRSGTSRSKDDNKCGRGGRGKTGTGRQFKAGNMYMYTTVTTAAGFGNQPQTLIHSATPAFPSTTLPINHYTTATIPTSPFTAESDGNGKEKKSWGGFLWRTGKKEGVERE